MAIFTIKLERTVASREIAEVMIDADDFGDADRQAREQAKAGVLDERCWRTDMREHGKIVVVDVEERRAERRAA
ncbi:hypothetical protein G3545_28785 [Starkeya sp. ORNL1]|uniref:hypothetical protein n=1 Tax=Starkeya sp. ORNL1 TaxID=2709380 RepID=UPI001463E412|nr:hypothetical protein [Starkeya sp. ORNL1]QJP17288.1 hypothetical protein G3545_28785 [Starkeya sp. ORNL1]